MPADQIELARQAFQQEREDAAREPTTPLFRLPDQLLLRIHDELLDREFQDRNVQKSRSVVVSGGSKHHAVKPLQDLQCVKLAQLKLAGANRGKSVLLKIHSKSCRTSALHVLAVDGEGWMIPLSIYHATANLEKLLLPGTVLAVREPYIKSKAEGYFIRVDTPSDLDVWPPHSASARPLKSLPITLEQYRAQGGDLFAKQRWHEAISAYEAAIWHFSDANEVSVLRLNASAGYLKIRLPGKALQHLDLCDSSALTALQAQKLDFRRANALYDLRRYSEAQPMLRLSKNGTQEPSVKQLQEKIEARLAESEEGPEALDWPRIYKDAQQTGSPDVADWVGPLEIRSFEDRGRGLCATRGIHAGEVLLVAKPLAIVRPMDVPKNVIVGINLVSGTPDAPSQVSVVSELIERTVDDKAFAHRLGDIYAGPWFPPPSVPQPARAAEVPPIDAGRIEGMITYNSFKPESCVVDMLEEDIRESQQSEMMEKLLSPSGLYHIPSMINHACLGNAHYTFYGDVLVVRSTEAIGTGQEVLFAYCEAAAPLEERQEHLARYGFSCSCALCIADQAESAAKRKERKRLHDELGYGSLMGPDKLHKTVEKLQGTYIAGRSEPKPALYRAFREVAYMTRGVREQPNTRSRTIKFEVDALRAIGAEVAKEGWTSGATRALTRDPKLMLQDAIISCFDIAYRYHLEGNSEKRSLWFREGKRLHDKDLGEGLLNLRMKRWAAKIMGWQAMWEFEMCDAT